MVRDRALAEEAVVVEALLDARTDGEIRAVLELERLASDRLGPIANGLLSSDDLASLSLRGYPAAVLTGSHAAGGSTSQDGLIGLRRALLAVGARSVVGCGWDTADEPAAIFAAAFHKCARGGGSQADAVRAGAHAVREADGGKWAHPAFWAGWSVMGAGAL